MSLAFLYAGQGAQHIGMGADLYTRYPGFADVWDRSTSTLDFDLKELCLEGPAEKLDDTRYTQPCMVAFAAGVTAVLYEHDIHPGYAAGLSLGEYSALHAAGAWDAQTTIALAAFRGEAMARATQGRPCKMAAILGLSDPALEEACQAASSTGTVEIVATDGHVKLFVQIASMPEYHERVLRDGLVRKLHDEYGSPPHKAPPEPPKAPSGDAGTD